MLGPIRNGAASLAVLTLLAVPAACAQEASVSGSYHPNSIQPETTVSISATATVEREPDIAIMTTGVQTDARTAAQAVAENAKLMASVFKAVEKAGIAEKDMQTSNFSLHPQYNYSSKLSSGAPRLTGYRATNQLSVTVRDLDSLGETMDALVSAGSNQFNGLQFALDDPSDAKDEARRGAMQKARERAELYAAAAGLKVKRIVTISEGGGYNPGPMPMARAWAQAMDSATPIATGEVGYSITVSVVFELG
jgi:uncharacterized protein YggE